MIFPQDKWIAHQDDFNELLAQLNSCHGQNSSSGMYTKPDKPLSTLYNYISELWD